MQIAVADPCSLSVDEGKGDKQLERYYYDKNVGNCQQFIYRGVKGNENSFLSYEECKQKCMSRYHLISNWIAVVVGDREVVHVILSSGMEEEACKL